MSKTKFVLENEIEPVLFIFKNDVAIMLTEPEIKEIKEILKDI